MTQAPVLFVDHGSPMNAVRDSLVSEALAVAAGRSRTPEAIVVVSAHWETDGPIGVTESPHPGTIHDFGGFPEELYRIRYPAPGEPALARRVVAALLANGLEAGADPDQGLDHGAWVPLLRMYPEAGIPVVQVALPTSLGPAAVYAMGKALAPLRSRGTMLLASGGIVHNLTYRGGEAGAETASRLTRAFEDWIVSRLATPEPMIRDLAGAPGLTASVPTAEHFLPLFFALGAAAPGDSLDVLARGPVGPVLSQDVLLWRAP